MTRTASVPAPVSPDTSLTIDAVIAGRLVRPLFQPIVDLTSRTVVGLEALARGPAGSVLEFPDRLFAAAAAAGRLGELDMLCAERALECALAAQNPPPLLFVNAEPAVLDQPLSPRLLELVGDGLPFREVLEFTERALTAVPGSMLRITGVVQQWGNSIALDDVGVDPASLAFLPVLEPEVIKLDMNLIRNPDDPATRAVCAVVRAEARRTGAVVIAEGIETEEHLRVAEDLGAHWGQGWLFGRPARIGPAQHRYDAGAAGRIRAPRPGFHQPAGTPFGTAARHGPVVPATPGAVAAELRRLRQALIDDDTAVVVASCPDHTIPGLGIDLRGLLGRARSVILLDQPLAGEFAVTLIGAGYGYGLCLQQTGTLRLVALDHLPAVAAVARILLNLHD